MRHNARGHWRLFSSNSCEIEDGRMEESRFGGGNGGKHGLGW